MICVYRLIYLLEVERYVCHYCDQSTRNYKEFTVYNPCPGWRWKVYRICQHCEMPFPHWFDDDEPSLETCGCSWCLKYFIWKKGIENIPPPRWVKMTRNRPLKECMMCYEEKTRGKWKCGQCRQYPCCEKCIEKFTVTCYRNCPLCRYTGH